MSSTRQNNQGSILIATTGFALVFTLFGIASIYSVSLHNESVEKQKLATEAFWLADGGIEKARSLLPETALDEPAVVVDKGRSYAVSTVELEDNRWQVNAVGIVNDQRSEIEAEILAPETKEIVKNIRKCTAAACGITSNLQVCVGFGDCSFEEIFPDVDFQETIEGAAHYTIGGNLVALSGISMITVDTLAPSVPLPVKGEGFLIVDVTPANNNGQSPITLNMAGADFSGIIWITGNAQINNPNIKGAVLAYAGTQKVAAYASIYPDDVLRTTVETTVGKPRIVAWREK